MHVPMNLTLILKQPQRNRMHRRIPPPLIKEPARPIQMVEIILIRLTPPKLHVSDFEIAPEMTRRISIRFFIMFRSALLILQPRSRILGVVFQVFGVGFGETHCFGPQRGDGFGIVVEVDGEAVGFVVVLHVAENIVVNVAEEMHFGFDPPVVAYVFEGRVTVEETAVPATHLVVGDHGAVLGAFFGEHAAAFAHEVGVYPVGDYPVFFWDEMVVARGLGFGAGFGFEVFGEGFVVEEGPGVVEFVVPGSFEVAHGLDHAVDFFIADEGKDGGIDSRGVGVVGGVVVGSP